MAWLDEKTVAVEGIGHDVDFMIDGARIFDITSSGKSSGPFGVDRDGPREVLQFPGPAGSFFSDGVSLLSSDQSGLSRWDPSDGARTGHLAGFRPTRHHPGSNDLAELVDGVLVRWRCPG